MPVVLTPTTVAAPAVSTSRAYTTIDLVRAQHKSLQDTTSPSAASDADIAMFIVQAGQIMDGLLSQRYVTPIASPWDVPQVVSVWASPMQILETIATYLATAAALRRMLSDRYTQTDERGPWVPFLKQAMDLLELVVSNNLFVNVPTVVLPGGETGEQLVIVAGDNDLLLRDYDWARPILASEWSPRRVGTVDPPAEWG